MRNSMNLHHTRTKIIIACILVAALAALSLIVGKYPLTVKGLIAGDTMQHRVLFNLRIPRTVMALMGGTGLGVAGFVFQTIFKNPLAAPDIIGVSSGASAGAAFSIVFISSGMITVTVSAFAGGVIAVLLSLILAGFTKGSKSISIVLAGIAVQALSQTALMVFKLAADPEKQLASIEYWIMGSLNGISITKIPFSAGVCIACIAIIFIFGRQLLMLSLDEGEARMLGVPVRWMRFALLLIATFMVAAIISLTGLISFVGLIAPHSARLLTGDNRKSTMILSGLAGAIILTGADILARSVAAVELPVSVFTSILGAPFLVMLVIRRCKKYE